MQKTQERSPKAEYQWLRVLLIGIFFGIMFLGFYMSYQDQMERAAEAEEKLIYFDE